jgi:ribosomal protein L37AE/L43A
VSALPSYFRDNYDADRVRRVCLTWRPGAFCIECGKEAMQSSDGLWACWHCGAAGQSRVADTGTPSKSSGLSSVSSHSQCQVSARSSPQVTP